MGGDDLGDLSGRVRGAFGRVHEHHDEVTSTNDRAMDWLKNGAPHGAVVTADAQTSGRGRRGRTWTSAPGQNLCVSVIVLPTAAREDFGAVSLAVGLGLLRGLGVAAARLKWPNDLLVDGRKLGGILCETRWADGRPQLVVGFGINVHQERFEGDLADTATSLAAHGFGGTREGLLADLLLSLEGALTEFEQYGFAGLREAYLSRCSLVGESVAATHGGEVVEGVVQTIDESGALVLVGTDGKTRVISSGEVQRVRPKTRSDS